MNKIPLRVVISDVCNDIVGETGRFCIVKVTPKALSSILNVSINTETHLNEIMEYKTPIVLSLERVVKSVSSDSSTTTMWTRLSPEQYMIAVEWGEQPGAGVGAPLGSYIDGDDDDDGDDESPDNSVDIPGELHIQYEHGLDSSCIERGEWKGIPHGSVVLASCLYSPLLVLSNVVLIALDSHSHQMSSSEGADRFKRAMLDNMQVIERDTIIWTRDIKEDIKEDSKRKEHNKVVQRYWKYRVVESRPLIRGIISDGTVVTILPPTQEKEEDDESHSTDIYHNQVSSVDFEYVTDIDDDTVEQEHPRIGTTTCALPINKHSLFMSSFVLPGWSREGHPCRSEDKAPSLTASVRLLSHRIAVSSSSSSREGALFPPPTDHAIEIAVPLCTLRRLRIFSGGWVVVEWKGRKKLCRAYAWEHQGRDKYHTEDLIYINPILCFNLDISEHILVSKDLKAPRVTLYACNSKLTATKITKTKKSNSCIPYVVASRATIARVRSESSSGQVSYSHYLSDYFSVPRVLGRGDIFGVPVPHIPPIHDEHHFNDYPGGVEEEEEGEGEEKHSLHHIYTEHEPLHNPPSFYHPNQHHLVYFKVEEIQGNEYSMNEEEKEDDDNNNEEEEQDHIFYMVDKNITSLVQHGAVHSFIPPSLPRYLSSTTQGSTHDHTMEQEQLDYQGMDGVGRVVSLVSACVHPAAGVLGLECSMVLYGPRAAGKQTIARRVAASCGMHILSINCYTLLSHSDVHTEVNLRRVFADAQSLAPVLLLLRHVDAFDKSLPSHTQSRGSAIGGLLRELIERYVGIGGRSGSSRKWGENKGVVVLVATTISLDDLSPGVRNCFRYEQEVSVGDKDARLRILCRLVVKTQLSRDVVLSNIATKCAAFTPRDICIMTGLTSNNALSRLLHNFNKTEEKKEKFNKNISYSFNSLQEDVIKEKTLCMGQPVVCTIDFEEGINMVQGLHSTTVGAPSIPNTKWDDVGGLHKVKKEILDTVELPLRNPHLFGEAGSKRSGILLYGPPGTGKTLMAKAVATECSLNFMSVKGPELLNMYVGESEKNIREVFTRARNARPCIIFFDELDSLAPNRGASGDSGGVMDRIVSQLLAELDGLHKGNDVFVIGATNRPDLLDPALLRPGRFDRLLYLSVSSTHTEQLKILQALTRKFHLDEDLELDRVAQLCPLTLTGADFYALCSDAQLNAIKGKIAELESLSTEERALKLDTTTHADIHVKEKHFIDALENIIPSVSEEELLHYEQLKKTYAKQNTMKRNSKKKMKEDVSTSRWNKKGKQPLI